jgi:Serine/threonine protein kinase
MDYIEGESLNAVLRNSGENKLEQSRALNIARQIAVGLAHAHALGIVHRDIKPSNIILSRDENGEELVKIIDFGIAYDMDGEVSAITAAGHVVGSPLFMSPEQCLGRALDARSDIYSLGSLCYRMLCGEPIYQETSLTNLMHLQVTTRPASMRSYDSFISEELDNIVLKALAKRPLDRFQTAAEFVGALDALTETGNQDADRKIDEQAA